MSQVLEQQLSAFLDGELPAEELDLLLAHLDRDAAQRLTLATIRDDWRMRARWRSKPGGTQRRGASANSASRGYDARGCTAQVSTCKPVRMAGGRRSRSSGCCSGSCRQTRKCPGWRTGRAVRQDNTVRQLTEEPLSSVTAAANHRLNPRAAARLTGYLVAHGQYTNQLSRSTFDSHLVTARAERASWRQPQDLASVQ